MTDREKIIDIILNTDITERAADRIADDLIENDIGDVAEWKRRAEVAERALKIAATRLKCYGGLGEGFCAVSDCEYRHCSNDEGCVLAHLRQAAREIEEEKGK